MISFFFKHKAIVYYLGALSSYVSQFFSLSWYDDADDSSEDSLVDNGLRAIHINVDCVDGALQLGSQADAFKKPFWYDDIWLCFANLCILCYRTLE